MEANVTPSYKDRSTGLIVFGVFEILLGLAAGGMGLLVLVVGLIRQQAQVPNSWAGSIIYLTAGVALIWLGIGSVMARRWARALILMLSWIGIAVGVFTGAFFLFIMPGVLEHLSLVSKTQAEAQFVKWFAMIFLGFFIFIIYIVIPGALILFYRSPHVKATCEAKNPLASWTDGCPLPVLALCLLMAFGALLMALLMPAYGFVVPLFGTLGSGVTGALVTGISVLLLVYFCWGFYRLKAAAWWAALVFYIVSWISTIWTFSQVGLLEMYQKMNFPEQTIELVRNTGLLESNFMLYMFVPMAAFWLGYLAYIKKYFSSK